MSSIECIGEGAQSCVWKETSDGDSIVVKRFKSGEKRACHREAYALKTLKDTGISPFLYEAGSDYIRMEFIEGRNLWNLIGKNELSVEQKIELMIKLSNGVQKIREAKMVHSDLSPTNILIGTSNGINVKIIDYGLTKEVHNYLHQGVIGGRTRYAPPEIYRDVHDINPFQHDIFSLGVIFFELLFGVHPYSETPCDEKQVVSDIRVKHLRSVQNPEVPVQVKQIVQTCLKKDPKERYSSTKQILRDLSTH